MHLHRSGYDSRKAGQSTKTGATSQERYLVEGGRQVGGIQGTAGPKVNQIYPLPKPPQEGHPDLSWWIQEFLPPTVSWLLQRNQSKLDSLHLYPRRCFNLTFIDRQSVRCSTLFLRLTPKPVATAQSSSGRPGPLPQDRFSQLHPAVHRARSTSRLGHDVPPPPFLLPCLVNTFDSGLSTEVAPSKGHFQTPLPVTRMNLLPLPLLD